MKPLLVLLAVFGLLSAGTYIIQGEANYLFAGNAAMAAMLLFAGAAHFALTKGMMQMLPEFLPGKKAWVYATGVIEIVAALGLLLPAIRAETAGCLIVFFLLILPANIVAAQRHLNYQTCTYDGPGPHYLWFRIPLQLFFIGWTWYFGWYLHIDMAI
jgi:uncharacterized membrane protein